MMRLDIIFSQKVNFYYFSSLMPLIIRKWNAVVIFLGIIHYCWVIWANLLLNGRFHECPSRLKRLVFLWLEMGIIWIINLTQTKSSFYPLSPSVLCFAVVFSHLKLHRKEKKLKQGFEVTLGTYCHTEGCMLINCANPCSTKLRMAADLAFLAIWLWNFFFWPARKRFSWP